jgi:Zn-dependent protease
MYAVLLGMSFAIILVAAAERARNAHNPGGDWLGAIYIVAFVLAVVAHELGHLVAGKLVEFRFNSIAIGPLSLRFEYGRLTFQVRRALPAGGYAGMHVNHLRRLRRRLLIFAVGGPVANFVSAFLSIVCLNYFSLTKSWLSVFIDLFSMTSLVLGVVSLLPLRLGALYSDGSRISMLFTSREKSRRWMSICAIGAQSTAGIRSRDYRRTWLDAAGAAPDGSVDDFAGSWISYRAANDRKDAPVAAQHLERCLGLVNLLGPSLQDTVALEAAVFASWFRADAELARKWHVQVKKPAALPHLMNIRFEVALACADKEYGRALSRWQDGFAFIDKLPSTPIKKTLSQSFTEWRGEIQDRERAHLAEEARTAQETATQLLT